MVDPNPRPHLIEVQVLVDGVRALGQLRMVLQVLLHSQSIKAYYNDGNGNNGKLFLYSDSN